MKIKIMIDTCVWLDMLKDYRQQPVIEALENLIHADYAELLVPNIIVEEFQRNKSRVAADASRSLQSHFSVVRDAVLRFGDRKDCAALLTGIDSADYTAVIKGEAVNASIQKIDELLASVPQLSATDAVKSRVADRALGKRAPFHKSKNSAADALIIEIFADQARLPENSSYRYAFVTHNKVDFSSETGDHRVAHPDLQPIFSSLRITYWTSLTDLIDDIDPDLLANLDLGFVNGTPQPRRLSEISGEIDLLFRQIWYNRHQNLRIDIENGEHFVVPKENYATSPYKSDQTLDTVWEQALAAAKRTEEEVGLENLGPWDDFDWGMINGKLSALRWILGYEWDMLDT